MHTVHCLCLSHGIPVGFDDVHLGCDAKIDSDVFERRG